MRGDTEILAKVFFCKPSVFKLVRPSFSAKSIRGVRFQQWGVQRWPQSGAMCLVTGHAGA
jgi:hypothetical protein